MMGDWKNWANAVDWNNPWMRVGFGALAFWSVIWQGLALWKSAKNDDKYWFVAFMFLHTAGILEILYLFVFAKKKLTLSDWLKTKLKIK